MNDEQDGEQIPAETLETAPSATLSASSSPLARPLRAYVVRGRLEHDGVSYTEGSPFSSPDEALIADLRRVGALALPEELMRAEELATQAQAQAAEIARLNAEVERLRREATQATQATSRKGR